MSDSSDVRCPYCSEQLGEFVDVCPYCEAEIGELLQGGDSDAGPQDSLGPDDEFDGMEMDGVGFEQPFSGYVQKFVVGGLCLLSALVVIGLVWWAIGSYMDVLTKDEAENCIFFTQVRLEKKLADGGYESASCNMKKELTRKDDRMFQGTIECTAPGAESVEKRAVVKQVDGDVRCGVK